MGMSPIRHGVPVITVQLMTLRDDIRGLLTEPGGDSSGLLGDVPSDLVSTLLTHFADTAPIEQADVLAPMVMQASPVPFDEELDGIASAPLDDPIAELGLLGVGAASTALVDHDDPAFDDAAFDRDPDELDSDAATSIDDVEPMREDEREENEFGSGSTGEADTGDTLSEPAASDVAAEQPDAFGYVADDADPMDFDASALESDALFQPVDDVSSATDVDDDFGDMLD